MASDKVSLRRRYKALRKRLLEYTPFIKRSRHERIVARINKHLDYVRATNEGMGSLFFTPPPLAATAPCEVRVPVQRVATDELCLFVTHAASPDLKPHVVDHIDALLEGGVAVLLIANTDLDPSALRIPPELAARLYGCVIRKNVGFDFAAWAHGYCLIDPPSVRKRLYLINDSIIGPLDRQAYALLLQRIRASPADAIGMTANPDPHDHLQSYYLVFNERLLHSATCHAFMHGVVNMPMKQNVIDCYEIWLSRFLEQQGFRIATIFPKLSTEPPPNRNDTLCSWSQLVDLGFPFVKSMVLKDPLQGEAARARVPAKYQ